jgi:hypothetical protein
MTVTKEQYDALKYQADCAYAQLMKFREVLNYSKISPEEMDIYEALQDCVMGLVNRVNEIVKENENGT